MIATGFIREAVSFFVWVLGRAAATGEPESKVRQHRDGGRVDRVTGIGEGCRRRNTVRGALRVDRLHLLVQFRKILLRQAHVIAGMVADLETVLVQLRDLLPREVLLFVRPEREPFGNEERRAKAVLLQQGTDDGVLTRF
jgi:hypothetical protein